jgi:hypothetical protein
MPIDRFFGEPDTENSVNSFFASSVFEFRLNNQWLLKQNLSYTETDGDYQLRSAWQISDDGTK